MTDAEKKTKSPLGRVSSLGPKQTWQSAFLLPNSWDDLRFPITQFNQNFMNGSNLLFHGRLNGDPQVIFGSSVPRMTGSIVDQSGFAVSFVAFGDSRDLQQALNDNADNLYLMAHVSYYKEALNLKDLEVVDPRWVGRLRPRYAGKPRYVRPEQVRDTVVGLLREALPMASSKLAEAMNMSPSQVIQLAGAEGADTIERLIINAHLPRSVELGIAAQRGLELLAASKAIKVAKDQLPKPNGDPMVTTPQPLGAWQPWADQLPFKLSDNQQAATEEIVNDMRSPKPMRRLLSGDVGYGKTAVFSIAAATIYGAGGRVVILLPNETLAEQAAREIISFWPQLNDDLQLVVGSTDTSIDLTKFRWLVGTTALLFRDVGGFHLTVVDEQQKFSREQREQLLKSHTHLLEATATCIPRSQALIQFGGFTSTILDVPPIPRNIITGIRYFNDRRQLFLDAKATLEAGDQVLVVYPRKGESKKKGDVEDVGIHDVEAAAGAWEKLWPGQVRIAHGGRKDVENEQALLDMREGVAKVLVATTVVEVGVNIPRLRRVIIVHPHRFGLSTLHQIRGRVARTGGEGHCDLYLPEPPKKEDSLQRLEVLVRTQNGFEVAHEDLMIRGCGNLSSNSKQQKGAGETILFGRALTPDMLNKAIER